MSNLWNLNPAAFVALVTAVIDVIVTAGVPLSDPLKAAIIGLATVASGLVIRSQVTPNATVARKVKAARAKKAMPKG